MNVEAVLDRLLVFAVAASLVGLLLGWTGGFSPAAVLVPAVLAAWAWRPRAVSPDATRPTLRWRHLLPVLLVALLLRWPPYATVLGGQDQGLYSNIAAELLRSGDLRVEDAELARIAAQGTPARDTYIRENYRDPFLPGVYTSEDGRRELTFQFYHLFPVWLATAGGLLGLPWAGVGLVFLALLSVAFFMCLAATLGGQARFGVAAGLLLALNPLHAFFSKFPVSEVPALAFACAGFALAARYARVPPAARDVRWLWLSAASFACLFLTRITGFLYLPVLWAIGAGAWVLDADRARARALAGWSTACLVAYLLSVVYGLAWSRPYALDIYEGAFAPMAGAAWPGVAAVALLAVVLAWLAAWRGWLDRPIAWLDARASRWLGALVLAFLLLALLRGWKLGFAADAHALAAWSAFEGLAGAGWHSLAHLSVWALALYASPWLLLLSLALVLRRLPADGRILQLFLACLLGYLAVVVWVLPYQPYYGRYLASEAVPLVLLMAALAPAWWPSPRAQPVLRAGLVAAGLYFALLSAAQLGKREEDGAFASVAALAAHARDGDLLLVDGRAQPGLVPEELRAPLVYSFGRHAIGIGEAGLADAAYLRALDAAYDTVWLASASAAVPPGFQRVDGVPLHASRFRRTALPPLRVQAALDTTIGLYRLVPAQLEPDATRDFRVADDARLATQVGRRTPSGSFEAQGAEGYLLFGPYLPLAAGRYRVSVLGAATAGAAARVDVAHASGSRVLAEAQASDAGEGVVARLEFDVPAGGVADLEVRVFALPSTHLRVDGFRLTRLR